MDGDFAVEFIQKAKQPPLSEEVIFPTHQVGYFWLFDLQ